MELAKQVFNATQKMPKSELWVLQSQIKRSAISVPSNIAEGHGRLTDSQFRHFLGNARGSLYELQTQIELAAESGLIDQSVAQKIMNDSDEVAKMLNSLITLLGSSNHVKEK